VLGSLDQFAAAARQRAVERFALAPWLDRHAQLFGELLTDGAPRTRASRTH
jgi:hypothetical protein